MKSMLLLSALTAVLAAGPVLAQSAAELEKSKRCTKCHAQDREKVGPSYNDIAAKYKGQAGAADKLVAELKSAKTHPKTNASDAELRTLVDFILTGK